ncbi:MAG: Uncharacterised protein [Synechococcus sp. MIT S9220]|nr:MAG: Uncharacterised protein [Synechococcus sp. MIT S9220]
MIGSGLSLKVSPEQFRIPRRRSQTLQTLVPALTIRCSADAQPVVAHQKAFLLDAGAERGHGAWRQSAHIAVMAATGHKGEGIRVPLHETGSDRGDVGQMGAAMEGIVADHGVAWHQRLPLTTTDLPKQILDRIPHRTQMHRDVWRIGNESPLRVEKSTGEIQSLADIHRATGLAQPFTHALGNLHETVMEKTEIHRVRQRILMGPCAAGPGPGRHVLICDGRGLQKHAAVVQQPGQPPRFQHDARRGIQDQRRSLQLLITRQLSTLQHRHHRPALVFPVNSRSLNLIR